MTTSHTVKRLADYTPPDFTIEHINLSVNLEESNTQVTAVMLVKRCNPSATRLVLDGVDLELKSVSIKNSDICNYSVGEEQLSISVPIELESFTLTVENTTSPITNTSLEGLYCSNNAFCTQCEAEGFRKITYYLDRPDVLATFDVLIEADANKYPMLLSNGNKLEQGVMQNGRHWAKWQDPFPKPCYLFALVAGDFDTVKDTFVTQSGRTVALELFVDKGQSHRCAHALISLKKAMAWDEQTFGLEYDLDIYMIVAVDFFNMGAMENKGLNVFNSKCVLADPLSATDDDFFNIESIVAHEYFHNWTGNRVTCRDWFQLSLKEGLTVFRDQQFSNDMSSPLVNRIKNVRVMREHQFAEDAGPMSHPIRPEEVIEMNNFYTVTVYDKGAEVIRMLHTLLGVENFRLGIDLYFQRHDGQAVTCDDFVNAMEDASQIDLAQFRRWYSQSGTPTVTISTDFNSETNCYTLQLSQQTPATNGQPTKHPVHIPVAIELLSANGDSLPVNGHSSQQILSMTESTQTFSFDVEEEPVALSAFRGFSAPVTVEHKFSESQLQHIVSFASDEFSRWDAMQQLYMVSIGSMLSASSDHVSTACIDALRALLHSVDTSDALLAECMTLPSLENIIQAQATNVDILACHQVLKQTVKGIADSLGSEFLSRYNELEQAAEYAYCQKDVDKRRLRGVLMYYLANSNHANDINWRQCYAVANNMTDTLNVLKALQFADLSLFDELMADFESLWSEDVLVLDKWFAIHASVERKDSDKVLDMLMNHPCYSVDNPNRVRSVWGPFTRSNTSGFHCIDGSGYQKFADYLMILDGVNPQVAARLIEPLLQFKRYDTAYKTAMRGVLEMLQAQELSSDLYEKVAKALE